MARNIITVTQEPTAIQSLFGWFGALVSPSSATINATQASPYVPSFHRLTRVLSSLLRVPSVADLCYPPWRPSLLAFFPPPSFG